jgi:hypothetical protein
MNWKSVRLELAPTKGFPRGSAGRAFLLNVPLNDDGCIDHDAVAQNPVRATVRRFWASEPDSFGAVEPLDGRWALRCRRAANSESTFLLDAAPLNLEQQVNVQGPDGTWLPFRVASIRLAGSPPESR